jgi:hypothetical protein
MGRQFFEGTLPRIARALEKTAIALEKQQAPDLTEEQATALLDYIAYLQNPGDGTYRPVWKNEVMVILRRLAGEGKEK